MGGGIGNLKLIQKMVERGHKITVATPLYVPKEPVERKYKIKLEPFSPFYIDRYVKWREAKYICYAFLYSFHLYRLIRRNAFDIIFVRNANLALCVCLLRHLVKVKLFLGLTDFLSGFLYRGHVPFGFLAGLCLFIETRIPRFCDGVFVISNAMKNHLVQFGTKEQNIHVCYDGVDIDLFDPNKVSAHEIESMRKEIGFERNIVIFHGTIQPDHVDFFKQIIEKTLKKRPDINFLILGKGKGHEKLKEYILGNNVRFFGFVTHEKLPPLIAISDAGIIPYRPGFNSNLVLTLKLLEYLAMGLPVVSTRLETIMEVFSNSGFITFASNAEAFSESIIQMLARGKSKNAVNLIRSRFSWDIVAGNICKKIEKMTV